MCHGREICLAAYMNMYGALGLIGSISIYGFLGLKVCINSANIKLDKICGPIWKL